MVSPTRLERATHTVSADRAELRVEAGMVCISKQGVTRHEPEEIRLPLDRIRGADLEKPSRGRPGYLHVAAVGGTPRPNSTLAASADPYTVPITARNLGSARRFVRLVAEHVRARGLPSEPGPPVGRSTSVHVSTPSTSAAPAATRTVTPAPPVPPPGADA
ncbi:hypothetical protein [Egicoccus halophilus]|uniref:Uncharacterized protein n=1 Tax=Egicoccus halophilus TaxID=1670830 RepID=A0A8J3AAP4_9ACTN|nr:hypothetical protein [Egicoccus halophilus]GGI09329.1 hypothetical protein GCM10011354_33540 [Egicoccus halophilus]